jgi:hypothetical protein
MTVIILVLLLGGGGYYGYGRYGSAEEPGSALEPS